MKKAKRVIKIIIVFLLGFSCIGIHLKPQYAFLFGAKNILTSNSFHFNSSIKIQNLTDQSLDDKWLSLLVKSEITLEGDYQKDPQVLDGNLRLIVKDDFSVTINIPIQMDKEKIQVRIPKTLRLFIPTLQDDEYFVYDRQKEDSQTGGNTEKLGTEEQEKIEDLIIEIFTELRQQDIYYTISKENLAIENQENVDVLYQFIVDKRRIDAGEKYFQNKIKPVLEEIDQKQAGQKENIFTQQISVSRVLEKLDLTHFEMLTGLTANSNVTYNKLNLNLDISLPKQTFSCNMIAETKFSEFNNLNLKPIDSSVNSSSNNLK